MLNVRSVRRLHLSWMFGIGIATCIVGSALAEPWQAAKAEYRVPQSLSDLGDVTLSKASVKWKTSIRETRQIVDVVCLVPNRETFLKVLAQWDDKHYFPILFDDTEYAAKFIRAFRPKKVVRFPERPAPLPDDAIWVQSLTALVSAILAPGNKPTAPVRGNLFWIRDNPNLPGIAQSRSPGIVLTKGGNDSIAAAALAAGRRQGLMLWPENKGWRDILTLEEASGRANGLNQLIKETKVEFEKLGDDIDFVTLVGDLPYRYQTPDGVNCVDDMFARTAEKDSAPRWGYVGRITGSLESMIYKVMCGLFLDPAEALLFSGYDSKDEPFKPYAQIGANARLSQFGLKTEIFGDGSPGIWQTAFFPKNDAGMLFINTSGSPTSFNLKGGTGSTWDVPWSVPARIHIIHSFSAADASDPYTIAGRWLANGAYAYFGSVYEPYLQSFRSPGLIADALTSGYPWAAAVRQNPGREPFGNPWRLIVFGDPMMTARKPGTEPRRTTLERIDAWPSFAFEPIPPNDSAPPAKFAWCLRQYLVWASGVQTTQSPKTVLSILDGIDRDALPAPMRPTRDELLACLALESHQYELATRLAGAVPASERTPKLTRLIETAAYVRFSNAISRSAIEDAVPAWHAIVLVCASPELRTTVTAPLRQAINSPVRRRIWIRALEDLKSRKTLDPKTRTWVDDLLLEAENLPVQANR